MKNRIIATQLVEIILSILLGVFLVSLLRFLEYIKIVPVNLDEGFLVLIGLFITYLVTRFLGTIMYYISKQKFNESNAKNFKVSFEILFFTFVSAIIIFTVGVNITIGLMSAGFIGIILGIASQSVLANFFAGFYIIFAKPFNIGDKITIVSSQYSGFSSTYPHEFQIPEFTGTIEEIGFLYTKIVNFENVLITIPNSAIINAMIYNYSKTEKRLVRIRFDTPILDVENFKMELKKLIVDDKLKIVDIRLLNLFTDHMNFVIILETNDDNLEKLTDYILEKVSIFMKNYKLS